jgi:hypothetical protein
MQRMFGWRPSIWSIPVSQTSDWYAISAKLRPLSAAAYRGEHRPSALACPLRTAGLDHHSQLRAQPRMPLLTRSGYSLSPPRVGPRRRGRGFFSACGVLVCEKLRPLVRGIMFRIPCSAPPGVFFRKREPSPDSRHRGGGLCIPISQSARTGFDSSVAGQVERVAFALHCGLPAGVLGRTEI